MDFFKIALDFENETENYYRLLADKCISNEGVKNILIFLANDHHKHAQSLVDMENKKCKNILPTEAFKAAKKLFQSMKETKSAFNCNINQVQLYKKALDLVSKKYDFYIDSIDKLSCPDNQSVLKQIAEEERGQKIVLENIIEMIEKPTQWVENAEFYHFDEY